MFVPPPLPDSLELRACANKAHEAFLYALDVLRKQGRTVTDAPNSPHRFAKTMRSLPEAQGLSKRDLTEAFDRLIQLGRIKIDRFNGADRKPQKAIASVEL